MRTIGRLRELFELHRRSYRSARHVFDRLRKDLQGHSTILLINENTVPPEVTSVRATDFHSRRHIPEFRVLSARPRQQFHIHDMEAAEIEGSRDCYRLESDNTVVDQGAVLIGHRLKVSPIPTEIASTVDLRVKDEDAVLVATEG